MNRHDFLVLYFCLVNFNQSIFNTRSRVNFCGKNVFVNFLGGNYFCGSLEKWQKLTKLKPAKISCHTVSLVHDLSFLGFFLTACLYFWGKQ